MPDGISIVIPARNEGDTVNSVVRRVIELPMVDEVVVVDNGSSDNTSEAAAAAGAVVVKEAEPGMGCALRAGFQAAKNPWVVKIDADLEKFDTGLVRKMAGACAPGVGLVKGIWQDPNDDMPMTRLLVMPAIRLIAPGLSHVRAPNSGIYMFNRDLIDTTTLAKNSSADLDVMLRVHGAGHTVAEVEIGQIKHDSRNTPHYNVMAEGILELFLKYHAEIVRAQDKTSA